MDVSTILLINMSIILSINMSTILLIYFFYFVIIDLLIKIKFMDEYQLCHPTSILYKARTNKIIYHLCNILYI